MTVMPLYPCPYVGIITLGLNPIPHPACYSKQSFPRQLNFPGRLPILEPAFTHTRHTALSEFDLVFHSGECAGTVVGKVDAGERVRAEVFIAAG